MEIFILSVFVLGYLAITLEHNLKIDKLIPALIMMAIAWGGIAFGLDHFTTWFDSHHATMVDGFANLPHEGFEEHGHFVKGKADWLETTLLHHFGKTCEILFFLVGAMTIVEIIDHFNGFQTIKRIIKTNNKATLLWIVAILGFVLSAIIDNLTATIVLITILRKLIQDNTLRMWYAGMIIIAANAGGAWSPIGDVTTTMLWMGDKVTALALVKHILVPSLVCMILPIGIASILPAFKGKFEEPEEEERVSKHGTKMLIIGLTAIIFVPVFKMVTHLPPYVGMMLSLGIVSLIAEFISNREFTMTSIEDHGHVHGPTFRSLSKIEMPSILFFLGILMTVAALESLGMIYLFGNSVLESGMNLDLFVVLLGAGSAVIDNVPLVAASMGMFQEATDSSLWHFIAYSAGTGGSMLVIGSAAGVVAMGMEKISFFWYVKKISWLALVGFLAGAGVFLAFQ